MYIIYKKTLHFVVMVLQTGLETSFDQIFSP